MSKLPEQNRFLDLSDYGRPVARIIASSLKNTWFTPIHLTISFIISGLIAVACLLNDYYWATAFFLILKSILDAADGELARVNNSPSYTGRYFDSVADIILNFIILLTIWYITDSTILFTLLAFLGIQLQGTLYNYYYVILRNRYNGDTTSRVFETEPPIALKGEKQYNVNLLFRLYTFFYGAFDKAIHRLDKNAIESRTLPNWFMTAVSSFGLGFQLLIISVMLTMNLKEYIIPFFMAYSFLILVFIGIRKFINR
ncbi:MAG: CDP-alcohol phosphatidyltransferase family protein [Flavobacteriaceae bacterium]